MEKPPGFEALRPLSQRQPGDAHPFVAPADFQLWLDELQVNAEKKLEQELADAG